MRLFLAAVTLVMATTPAGAQWLDRKTPGIPRSADGKPNLTAPAPRGPDGKPDLTGVWDGPAVVARPDVDNLQPWVRDLVLQRQQEYYKTRPYYQCLPSGPEAERFGGWKRFLQTPAVIAILNDDLTYRLIHMDGRQLEADPAPNWMGYSVGRWDGDTLVIETSGVTADIFGVAADATLHSTGLRTVERYARSADGKTLMLTATLEDIATFREALVLKKIWGWAPDQKIAAYDSCERPAESKKGGNR